MLGTHLDIVEVVLDCKESNMSAQPLPLERMGNGLPNGVRIGVPNGVPKILPKHEPGDLFRLDDRTIVGVYQHGPGIDVLR